MDKLGPYKLNSIVTGDARDLLAALPDACIDLTVTSPPYDNLRDYKGYSFDFKPVAAELLRVTKQGGVVVWVVGDATVDGSETGTSFGQALGFMRLGFRLHDTMIYEKAGPSHPEAVRYHQVFEYMFVLSKGQPKTFHPLKDRKNRWPGSWGKVSQRQRDGCLQSRPQTILKQTGRRFNIWKYTVGKGFGQSDETAYQHPATFPEALARDHVLSWSDPGDVILDPMCGSGTTLKMAKQLGRRYLGFDISEEYTELARLRVEQANPPLFMI